MTDNQKLSGETIAKSLKEYPELLGNNCDIENTLFVIFSQKHAERKKYKKI